MRQLGSLLLLVAVASLAACNIAPPAATPTLIQEPQATSTPTQVPPSPAGPSTPPSPTPTIAPTPTVPPLNVTVAPSSIPAYDRDSWRHWTDADSDCQNTRAEVLIDESLAPVRFANPSACRVISGEWLGLYTDTPVTNASSLDVDHMVPLANAHASGAWAWSPERKRAYANDLTDPNHLIAVTASANRSKGAKGPEEWRPPNQSYWCEYADNWIKTKTTWDLSATPTELVALQEMLETCD